MTALTIAIVAVFVLVLALFAGGLIGGGDKTPQAKVGTSSTPFTSAPPSASTDPSGSSSSGTLGGLPSLGPLAAALANVNLTHLRSFGPGQHRVVLTMTSDANMLGAVYATKGEKKATYRYNVASPVILIRTVSGGRPYGGIAMQMGPTSHTGSCSVSIDGVVVDHRTASKPYAVMGCVG